MDMSDKFSILVRNTEDNIIDAYNIVGGTFSEVEKMVRQKEQETGNTYIITKDEYIFQAIYVLQSKYIDVISKLVDIRDDINDVIKNED